METDEWIVNKTENFELTCNYRVKEYLGSGAYGVVVSAYDSNTKKNVAIKKFKSIYHSRSISRRTLRELRILRMLDHPNIVKLKTMHPLTNNLRAGEIYMILEIMDMDLSSFLKANKSELHETHVKILMFQLLNGLKYLHISQVVHRDIKPRNLLVNIKCRLKIADFGLAKLCHPSLSTAVKAIQMTDYVTTRYVESNLKIWNCLKLTVCYAY